MTALVANALGTILYASDDNLNQITALAISPSGQLIKGASTPGPKSGPLSHDVAIASRTAGDETAGNVFSSYFANANTGVYQYAPSPLPNSYLIPLAANNPLQFLPGIPSTANSCAYFTIGTKAQKHCWSRLSGMAFDADGDLWVNSVTSSDNGTFEFSPTGSPMNFVPDIIPGSKQFPVGLTIAPVTDPSFPGQVLIANFRSPSVNKIDPSTCTNQPTSPVGTSPGTCTETVFISYPPKGITHEPKYIAYNQSCPNQDNDGFVEICKQSNSSFPVSGIFDFIATAPYFSTGTIAVPVGECSGAIQVPSGTVTLTEAPQIGIAISDFTAISYDLLGATVNQLLKWTAPDLSATVNVVAGDVAQETLATVTDYEAPPGQLKICKIAGPGVTVGTEFSFTVAADGNQDTVSIEAGPPAQGGFCELAGTFEVNTPVTITEKAQSRYFVSSITVNPANRGSKFNSNSVVATIADGITEVDFTNTTTKQPVPQPLPTPIR
jgi:hypothetical protein